MSTRVRTVLGDIAPEELGATDYHEHLFQVSPLLRGDELDDETASTQEAELLRRAGAGAMVEATPTGLGRRPEAVARVSAGTGLRIVHVTGAHREAHYAAGDPLLDEPVEALVSRFSRDLFVGMDGTTVRAGAVKAGAGFWSFTAFERRVLIAVGQLAAGTGAPVMVHLRERERRARGAWTCWPPKAAGRTGWRWPTSTAIPTRAARRARRAGGLPGVRRRGAAPALARLGARRLPRGGGRGRRGRTAAARRGRRAAGPGT